MSHILTQEEVRALLAGSGGKGRRGRARDNSVTVPAPARNTYKAGQMNKLEQSYARRLDLLKAAGEVIDYKFEPFKLVLGKDNCTYKPDFLVILSSKGCLEQGLPPTLRMELHEVKGYWEEDARIKFKWAIDAFPWFAFVGCQYKKRAWIFERHEARA